MLLVSAAVSLLSMLLHLMWLLAARVVLETCRSVNL
jgi:hypothetical protein